MTPSTGEGIAVDEVEGVSLEALPAPLRSVPANAERILAPLEGRSR